MIDWTLDPRRRLLDRSLPLPGGFPGGSWLPGCWFGGRSGGGCSVALEGGPDVHEVVVRERAFRNGRGR